MEEKKEKPLNDKNALLAVCKEYLESAREAAEEWQDKGTDVWDMIHGRVDWSHKDDSMAKIHLNKLGLAHERSKAQFKKSMMNFDEWMTVEQELGVESPLMKEDEAKRFLKLLVGDCDFRAKIAETIGNSLVENVCAAKLLPRIKKMGKYSKLEIDLLPLNIRNFYFDPFGSDLFEIHESDYDKFQLLKLADKKPSASKPYYEEMVRSLSPMIAQEHMEKQQDKGDDIPQEKPNRRCNVILHEFYGTFLDDSGNIMKWTSPEGESFDLEGVVVTMANEVCIIDEPRKIPSVTGKSPFVRTKMLHTNDTGYGKSLLYPGYLINRAQDELFSAITDAALATMLNLVQVRRNLLEDPSQLDGGMPYGKPIFVNDQATDSSKAIEATPTGAIPAPVFSIVQLLDRETAENVGMNEFQLSGGRSSGGSSATERVQSQQSFEGLFDGLAMDLEDTFIEPLVTRVFQEGLGFADVIADVDLLYVFAGDDIRASEFKKAAKNPKKLYQELGESFRFRGKGIRSLMRNTRVAQSLTQLMATLGGIPPLMDQAERSFSFAKTFNILLKGFGIDPAEVALSEEEKQILEARQAAMEQAAMMQQAMDGGGAPSPGNANAPVPNEGGDFEPGNGAGQ